MVRNTEHPITKILQLGLYKALSYWHSLGKFSYNSTKLLKKIRACGWWTRFPDAFSPFHHVKSTVSPSCCQNWGRVCDTPAEGFRTFGEDQGININQETWIQGTIMVNHWFPLIRPASKRLFLRGRYVRLTSHNTIFDAIFSLDVLS